MKPGALQMDLAAHCGESTHGFYLTSLLAVGVATGWTESRAGWGKGYRRVGSAVATVRQALPMPLVSLHTDNGGEFLDYVLIPWCRQQQIGLTSGRPHRKNDQAYVEQKNWVVLRRSIGSLSDSRSSLVQVSTSSGQVEY